MITVNTGPCQFINRGVHPSTLFRMNGRGGRVRMNGCRVRFRMNGFGNCPKNAAPNPCIAPRHPLQLPAVNKPQFHPGGHCYVPAKGSRHRCFVRLILFDGGGGQQRPTPVPSPGTVPTGKPLPILIATPPFWNPWRKTGARPFIAASTSPTPLARRRPGPPAATATSGMTRSIGGNAALSAVLSPPKRAG